jgi:outer membrane lipoprotein SlyB
MENDRMLRNLGIAAMLSLALVMPVHEAAAQDALGGAILGGGVGALFGGALGGRRGAAIGAIVGAGTGAAIAAEGERRRNGYYYYRDGCYLQRPDGAWVLAHPRYCY